MEPINYHYKPSSVINQIFNENKQALKNKTIALLFLDKVSKLTSEGHKDAQKLYSYGYGSSLFSSLNMIEYLDELIPQITDPQLKEAVASWIEDEKKYLKYADQLDTWRASPEMVKYVLASKNKKDKPVTSAFNISEQEIQQFASNIEDEVAKLQPGQTFKMLGGTSQHEVRIRVTCLKPNLYELVYFDPDKDVHGQIVDTSFRADFWYHLVKFKLTHQNGIPAKLKNAELSRKDSARSKQLSLSCPAQSLLGDLKYHIVNTVGAKAYKELKQMLIKHVAQKEKGKLDPIVEKYLNIKARTKGLTAADKKMKKTQFLKETIVNAAQDDSWWSKIYSWFESDAYTTNWDQVILNYIETIAKTSNELPELKQLLNSSKLSPAVREKVTSRISRLEDELKEKKDQLAVEDWVHNRNHDFGTLTESGIRQYAWSVQSQPDLLFDLISKLKNEPKAREALTSVIGIASFKYGERVVRDNLLQFIDLSQERNLFNMLRSEIIKKMPVGELNENEKQYLHEFIQALPVLKNLNENSMLLSKRPFNDFVDYLSGDETAVFQYADQLINLGILKKFDEAVIATIFNKIAKLFPERFVEKGYLQSVSRSHYKFFKDALLDVIVEKAKERFLTHAERKFLKEIDVILSEKNFSHEGPETRF